MVTVSAAAKKLVDEKPLLQEGLRQGIISFAALAERIKPQVEQQLGKKIKEAAIVMALRRHGEALEESDVKRISFEPHIQLTLKTNLVYFSVKRSTQLFRKLEELYKLFDYGAGDTFNIIHGNYEVSIITNEKHEKKIAAAASELGAGQVTTREKNLVSISMSFGRDFPYTPGALFAVTRKLYWDNVNIFEVVSAATELTLIFQKKDAMRAYASLQEMVDEKGSQK